MGPGGWRGAVQAGDKPPRYIFSFRHRPSVYKSARFAGGEPASRLIEGHIFVRRYENETWSLEVFGCGWCHPSPLDSRFRENDEGIPRMTNEMLPERSIPDRSPGHAFIAMTNSVAGTVHHGSYSGTCFRIKRPCRLVPAHQGMKSRSCGLVQRIGAADSATPHPDPSGGQAPRLAKSSTALHFLIPPSTIGLQIGTFRRWRAGIEVDWRAHSRTKV